MSREGVHDIVLRRDTNEEILPELLRSFPCERVYVDFSDYARSYVPWHWHGAIEFFAVTSGTVSYRTPSCEHRFEAGACGIVNASVPHTTKGEHGGVFGIEHICQADVSLLSGIPGGRIDERYFRPYAGGNAFEMLYFRPDSAIAGELRRTILEDDERAWGNEIRLRDGLTRAWIEAIRALPRNETIDRDVHDTIRTIVSWIDAHISEQIRVAEIAEAAYLSERECYRIFRKTMRDTPGGYILKTRLQIGCELLCNTEMSIMEIAERCGMGYSYFTTRFSEAFGLSPARYRRQRSEAVAANKAGIEPIE